MTWFRRKPKPADGVVVVDASKLNGLWLNWQRLPSMDEEPTP